MCIGISYSLIVTMISFQFVICQDTDMVNELTPAQMGKLTKMYYEINRIRRIHHVPKLSEAKSGEHQTLFHLAQSWAIRMAETGLIEHSSHKYGESFISFCGYSEDEFMQLPETNPVLLWYEEKKNFPNGTFEQWSNFTQMVWKGSRIIACGYAFNSRRWKSYVVCNYSPRGNIQGHYGKNVFQENGEPFWGTVKPMNFPYWRYILGAAIMISTFIAIIIYFKWPYLP